MKIGKRSLGWVVDEMGPGARHVGQGRGGGVCGLA